MLLLFVTGGLIRAPGFCKVPDSGEANSRNYGRSPQSVGQRYVDFVAVGKLGI